MKTIAVLSESVSTKIKTSRKAIIDSIFNPNEQGISNWVTRETLEKSALNFGTNGNGRHGIYFNDKRYIWGVQRGKQRKVIALRTNGFSESELYGATRPIRSDIETHHKQKGCVVCGTHSELVTDHKNDLYNDARVLNKETQTIDDFQCLCNHCNLQKRQIAKITKKTKKRIGATTIPSLAIFGIDFTTGDETFDETDVNAMVGTYWYDPVAFMKHIKTHFTHQV